MNFWQTLVIALLGGTVGGVLGIFLNNLLQVKQSKIEKRRQLYGKLIGLKKLLENAYYSTIWATIYFRYWQHLVGLENKDTQPIVFQDMKDSQRLAIDYDDKQGTRCAELYELLGLIRVIFPKDSVLDQMIEKCFVIKALSIKKPENIRTDEELDKWKKEKMNKIRPYLDNEVIKPLDSLINYLHDIIIKGIKK